METLGDQQVSVVSPRRSCLFFYGTLDEASSDPAGDLNSPFVRRQPQGRGSFPGARSHNRLSSPVAARPIKNVSLRNDFCPLKNNARDAPQLRRRNYDNVRVLKTPCYILRPLAGRCVNSRARVELLKPGWSAASQIILNLSPPSINCSARSNLRYVEAHQLFALLLQRSSFRASR